jgi:glycosyltransferase involved in cell wall biosynthesis
MRIGVYTTEHAATVGGGFVFRDEVVRAAQDYTGPHRIEIIGANRPVAAVSRSRLGRYLSRFGRLRQRVRAAKNRDMTSELERKKIDLLWFNHLVPLDVGVPYILNIFDLQHRLQPWFPEVSAGGQWREREDDWTPGIQRAVAVIVGSEEMRHEVSQFYGLPLDRVRAVPLPTPQGAIDAAQTADDGVAADELRIRYGIAGDFIYYPAQFWPHKNHVSLLRALARLHRDGRRLTLVLTGSDQGNRAHVEAVAAGLGLADHVRILGFIPHRDVIGLYRHAVALTFVSLFGPDNLPPLEAMALGCPVVLSNIPGVRTLFGDTPVFVDPRDEVAIAEGIARVLTDPSVRKRAADEGRRHAHANTRALYLQRVLAIVDEFEPTRRLWASGPWVGA